MRTKFLLTLFSFFAVLISKATDISFIVYNVTGTASKSSKVKIKKGDKIFANETLILADKAAVVLVCSNYKAIQLNKKGSYTAKSLLDQCTKDAAGYTGSYFKYVWNEFTHPHGKPETDPGEYMKNVGAVSRGCNSVSLGIAADTIIIGKGTVNLYWNSSFQQPVMRIFDVPVDGGPLQKTILKKGKAISMEEVSKGLAAGEYYWQITDEEGNGCERNVLKILEPNDYQLKVDQLINAIPFTTDAETAFARAFVLEENHFIAAAVASYRVAARLSPGNNLYKKTLARFYATPH